ncbi:MAG: hypothetical protein ACLUJU_05375 [Subdoligranulum sp.]
MKLQENLRQSVKIHVKKVNHAESFWKFVPWDSRAFRKQEWYTMFSTEDNYSIMNLATLCNDVHSRGKRHGLA